MFSLLITKNSGENQMLLFDLANPGSAEVWVSLNHMNTGVCYLNESLHLEQVRIGKGWEEKNSDLVKTNAAE